MPNVTLYIFGHTFTYPQRYQPGMVLGEAEAAALNSFVSERLRNNMMKRIKAQEDASGPITDSDMSALRQYFDAYAAAYHLRPPIPVSDPVQVEAYAYAKSIVTAAAQRAGVDTSAWTAEEFENRVLSVMGRESVQQEAFLRVKSRQDAALETLDLDL